MRPTVAYLQAQFDHYNRLCFGGQLPATPIQLGMRLRSMGVTRSRVQRMADGTVRHTDLRIEISVRRDLPEEEYTDTLVHEMIHCYIYYKGLRDSGPHGPVFRRLMEDINRRCGVRVTLRYAPDEATMLATRTQPRVVCVARLADGNAGVAVVARSRLFELWDEMARLPGVLDVRWWWSANGIFDRYPATTRARLRVVAAADVARWLADARELVRKGDAICFRRTGR